MRAQQARTFRNWVIHDLRGRKGQHWPMRPAKGGGGSFPPRRHAGTEAPGRSLDFKTEAKGGKSND